MKTEAMQWYLSLDINLRINAKTCFELLTGIRFEDLSFMFSFKERLGIMYNKLKLEGFQL